MNMKEASFLTFYEQAFRPTFTGPSAAQESHHQVVGSSKTGLVVRSFARNSVSIGYSIQARVDNTKAVSDGVLASLIWSTMRANHRKPLDTRDQYFLRAATIGGEKLKAMGIHGTMYTGKDKSYRYRSWEDQINELKTAPFNIASNTK